MISVWKLAARIEEHNLTQVNFSPPPRTLDEASRGVPGGAYTTFRTYERTKALRLAEHLERLRESAALRERPVLLDQAGLRQALRRILGGLPDLQEKRVRLTLDLDQYPGDVYIAVEPLHVPSDEDYAQGVQVITCLLRRQNPQAKLTDFILPASELRGSLPVGVEEALMVNEAGEILEGLSSNLFAVRQGVIWTAGEGVLSGITRQLVLEESRKLSIKVHFQAVKLSELDRLTEAFITSSSRGVLPVRKIDDIQIGSGKPGELTRKLVAAYNSRVQQEIEEI